MYLATTDLGDQPSGPKQMISLLTDGFQYPQAELAPPSLAFNRLCMNICMSLLPTGLRTQDDTWILAQKIITASRITSLLGESKNVKEVFSVFLLPTNLGKQRQRAGIVCHSTPFPLQTFLSPSYSPSYRFGPCLQKGTESG